MLNLVFTDKHLYAGAKAKTFEHLEIDHQQTVPLKGDSPLIVLQNSLGEIKKSYTSFCQYHSLDSSEPIPTNVALPPAYFLESDKIYAKDELIHFLRNTPQHGLRLITSDINESAFLRSQGQINALNENHIILSSYHEPLSLYFVHPNEPGKNVNGRMMPHLGIRQYREQLILEIVQELKALDLHFGENIKQIFRSQLLDSYEEDIKIKLNRTGHGLQMHTELVIGEELRSSALKIGLDVFKQYLDTEHLDKKGIKHLFLLGQYINHSVVKEYLASELSLGHLIKDFPVLNEVDYVLAVFEGLDSKAEFIIKEQRRQEEEVRRKEEERKRKLEEEAERLKSMLEEEQQALESRNLLFQEIKSFCQDESLAESYKTHFVAKGRNIGIPEDVINFHIQNALMSVRLQKLQTQRAELLREKDITSSKLPDFLTVDTPKAEVSNFSIDQTQIPEDKDPLSILPMDQDEVKQSEAYELEHQSEKTENQEFDQQNQYPEEQSSPDPQQEPLTEVVHALTEEREYIAENVQIAEQDSEEEIDYSVPEIDETIDEATIVKEEETSGEFEQVLSPEEIPAEFEEQETYPHIQNGSMEPHPISNGHHPPVEVTETAIDPELLSITTSEDVLAEDPLAELEEAKNLVHIFHVNTWLKDPEFASMRGAYHGSSEEVIVRLIRKNDLLESHRWENFAKVHEVEKSYFGSVSEIHKVKEGKYYVRNFIDGIELKDYMIKSGMQRKKSYGKLSTKDILLMLKVFDAVTELQVPHAEINEHNILIVPMKKWGLEKDFEIRFQGFTSEDVSKDRMFEKLHEMFEQLLQPNVYSAFLQKHIIV